MELEVHEGSKDYFENRPYNFLSKKLSDFNLGESDLGVILVDFNSPSLQKWMNRSIDIIRRKTGITPGKHEPLFDSDRRMIYQVWLKDIVPKIENPSDRSHGAYGFSRDMEQTKNQGKSDLGRSLEKCVGVCSEYGIQTKIIGGNVFENRRKPGSEGAGHVWLGVYKDDKLGEIINNNGARMVFENIDAFSKFADGIEVLKTTQIVESPRL